MSNLKANQPITNAVIEEQKWLRSNCALVFGWLPINFDLEIASYRIQKHYFPQSKHEKNARKQLFFFQKGITKSHITQSSPKIKSLAAFLQIEGE